MEKELKLGRWLMREKLDPTLGTADPRLAPPFEGNIYEWNKSGEYFRMHRNGTLGSEWYSLEYIEFIEKLIEFIEKLQE